MYQVSVVTVNEHLHNIYEDGELDRNRTIRKFRIVRLEGSRDVVREVAYVNLEAIMAVGYRVRSHRGTQSDAGRRNGCANTSSKASFSTTGA